MAENNLQSPTNEDERIEQLFLEALSRHGIFYMAVAAVLVLLWLYVDYVTEYANFKYFAVLRLSFSIPTLIAVFCYNTAFIQKNIRDVLFCCYALLTITLGLMVAASENLLLYSMGYSTVFLGTSVFLVWKVRYLVAGFPIALAIAIAHWQHLQASHAMTELTVVGAYMMNILCISALFTFVIYRSFGKQFKLLWENEQYEITLAAQVEEMATTNKALESANATKNKFFSIIAHDLRGPAGSLSVLFNDMISSGADLDEDILREVKITTKNLYNLLEELLSWARSQQGRIEVKPQNFAVKEAANESIALLDGNAKRKGIQIINAISEKEFLYADPALTTTVIRNLISNAIKYTSKGDTITISTVSKNGAIEVSVEDTGVGIKPEILGKLFKIEEKIESSLGTSNEAGTGLGLILCKEFVEKNGGEIGVDSEPGKGSRFWFVLPAGKSTVLSEEDTATANHAELTHLRILLVEDNDLHRKTSSLVLNDLGLPFKTACDGLEAIEMVTSEKFDIVLMDIDMPRMNGIEASKIITGASQAPCIFALSSYSQSELEELSHSFPFKGYLNKPLSKSILIKNLMKMEELSQASSK